MLNFRTFFILIILIKGFIFAVFQRPIDVWSFVTPRRLTLCLIPMKSAPLSFVISISWKYSGGGPRMN